MSNAPINVIPPPPKVGCRKFDKLWPVSFPSSYWPKDLIYQ